MDKKKENNIFLKILLILFIMFLCLYSVSRNGYARTINLNKTLYTEEQIKMFEEDVDNQEYLDLKEYLTKQDIDYSNNMSDFGEKVSNIIGYTAEKTMVLFDKLFSQLFV